MKDETHPMQDIYIQDKHFEKKDFTQELLPKGEYEGCLFNNCNFSDVDLSGFRFIDCAFHGCNLSLVKLNKTTLMDINFKECKMLGISFDTCNSFGLSFSFDTCQLDHCSFYKVVIKKTVFRNSHLKGADFTEADLAAALIDNCDLAQAIFDRTILEKADFRTSYNYSIDPASNRIKQAKFSINGLPGLLDKYHIHIEK